MKVIKINHYNEKQYGYQIIKNNKVVMFRWCVSLESRDNIVKTIKQELAQ